MVKINSNFLKLQDSYLFSTVNRKVKEYKEKYPNKKIINLGIGDVTKPLPKMVINAMKKACDEMGKSNTFKGYGPEQGYDFLKEKIIEHDYKARNIEISRDEVFISDGSKCDVGNIVDLFERENIVAITDPVYPVYLDTNVISGKGGRYDSREKKYENIIYMPCIEENNFIPTIPKKIPDIIYLCYPNNPTGTVLEKSELAKWVKFAKENDSIILFDSAYEAYIVDENIPHSIYEIEGAKEVSIEFRSFSKMAGFTGVRCAYTIVPKALTRKVIYNNKVEEVSLNKIWNRRHCTKFNRSIVYNTKRCRGCLY